MKLLDMRIRFMEYGEFQGSYVGEAKFSNDVGTVQINLLPKHCDAIFAVCADSIVDVASEVAQHLTANIVEHKKEIKG